MTDTKARITQLIAEIDAQELAVRIVEGMIGVKRVKGATPAQALSYLDAKTRAGAFKAAHNAASYIAHCISDGKVPS